MLLVKNPKFYSDQTDIQSILPTQELVILTQFHNDRANIVDCLL